MAVTVFDIRPSLVSVLENPALAFRPHLGSYCGCQGSISPYPAIPEMCLCGRPPPVCRADGKTPSRNHRPFVFGLQWLSL